MDKTSDLDETRELVRELHGLIKDGNRIKSDIREGRAMIRRELEAAVGDVARHYLKTVDDLMRNHAKTVSDAIDRANEVIQQKATELADMKTPEEFITAVVDGLGERVSGLMAAGISIAARDSVKAAHASMKEHGVPLPPAALPWHPPTVTAPPHPNTGGKKNG